MVGTQPLVMFLADCHNYVLCRLAVEYKLPIQYYFASTGGVDRVIPSGHVAGEARLRVTLAVP
jgi:hypothetical protein